MRSARMTALVACILTVTLLLFGCASTAPVPTAQVAPLSPTAAVTLAAQAPSATPTVEPSATAPATPTPGTLELVLLFTNDNWGETEPCGWGANATGGFRRRATFISQQRQQAPYVLLFDTGDGLIGGGILGERTKGEAIVAGMNLMQYDAAALGLKELSLGPELLRQRMAEARFPMLSANVVEQDTGRLVAAPYVVLNVGDHRFGVIGLTQGATEPLAGFQVLEPREALAGVLPEVSKQADTIVLLTNISYRSALELAAAVPGLDLVIASQPDQLPEQAAKASGTNTIVATAEQPLPAHTGRRVGRLAVTVLPDGSLTGASWQSVSMTQAIADDEQMRTLLDRFR